MNKYFQFWDTFVSSIVRMDEKNYMKISYFHNGTYGLRISTKEQIIFLKRFSMMLRAQMPIVDCLQMIANENASKSLKVITSSLAVDMSSGQSLGTAIMKYKKIFGFFCISIIGVGERTGTLPESLEYVAVELKKKYELRTQILSALVYPLIVIIATIAITVFLIVYIFPKIVPIFLSVKTSLPWSTKFLIVVSDFLIKYGWYVLIASVVSVFIITLLLRIPFFLYHITNIILRIPIVGGMCRFYNLAQSTRTLGLLLQNDIPITTALDITAVSTNNVVYKLALESTCIAVVTGKKLSSELQKNIFLFPPLLIQMIQAGENTGNMPTTLAYVSEVYESDIRDRTKNLTIIVEPLLMLLMGLVVGFIAISIITPIYGITQNIHQ
ncbi:type II secretion system F family protein [Patescibacteria group bacterium]|nr:type II secretion system F family protein [Patescibacteria group bacterium]